MNKFKYTKKSILNFILISSLTLLIGCSKATKVNKVDIAAKKDNDKLIISTFAEDKGNIFMYDVKSKSQTSLVSDRGVELTCDLSEDGSKVAYTDALNDSDPWQIYLRDLNNKKTYQVTNNKMEAIYTL